LPKAVLLKEEWEPMLLAGRMTERLVLRQRLQTRMP